MIRRKYLHALSFLSTLPSVPISEFTQWRDNYDTQAFTNEDSPLFWYQFCSTIQKDRVMSTERSRKYAVSEMELTELSDAEARRVLKRADDGEVTFDDMPDQWMAFLRDLDQFEGH